MRPGNENYELSSLYVCHDYVSCDTCSIAKLLLFLQTALQLLESLADLSPRARLLQSHTSILLADATCVLGGEGGRVEEEMVKVFQGLGALLKEQVCSYKAVLL